MKHTKTCLVCQQAKPASDFYSGNQCKRCLLTRINLWRANNPDKVKAASLKYRRSEKGRTTHNKYKQLWRAENSSAGREQHSLYLAKLPDAYMRKLLKKRGIIHPTLEQIQIQRRRIRVLRARRNMAVFNIL